MSNKTNMKQQQQKSITKLGSEGTTTTTGSVPEFIQKLFRMLENKAFKDTFCWVADGTTFIVKDTNEFSKTILPKHFKHCNFASFVRQLNKYDFHKVRHGEDGQKLYGDQAWEFVHPKFMRDRKDLLEEIKRKAPGTKQKKEEAAAAGAKSSSSSNNKNSVSQQQHQQANGRNNAATSGTKSDNNTPSSSIQEIKDLGISLQTQIDQLKKSRSTLEDNISKLKQTDNQIMTELVNFNKNMTAKDNLIKDFLRLVTEKEKQAQTPAIIANPTQAQKLLESYSRIAQTNAEQMKKLNQQLQLDNSTISIKSEYPAPTAEPSASSSTTTTNTATSAIHKSIAEIKQEHIPAVSSSLSSTDPETASAAAAAASMNAGALIGSPIKSGDGLTFVTLGRLSSNMSVRDNKPAIEIMAADQTPNLATTLQRPISLGLKRTINKSTSSSPSSSSPPFPSCAQQHQQQQTQQEEQQVSWTVPPRILLVDDDSVYRDLSGKLLSVIGCTIDLAKDGVEALKKMGLEKYDLILMDIVMPKMDGISATRSIRQYDALTPIISMTSNFTDNDIMQYIGSGMTDILPKPFSKRTLYQMLEKYCAHLKTIQRVTGLDPSTSLLNPSPLDGLGLLPPPSNNNNGESSQQIPGGRNSPSLTPQPQQQQLPLQQQQPPPPPYASATATNTIPTTATTNSSATTSNSSTSNSTSATPTAFPLAPYPYPVTMNSVPAGGDFNHVTNEIPNITFWPQQQPQQQDPPPAIIPNDGKFTWAVPTTASSNTQQQQQVFDPVAVALNESNKRRRME